MLAFFPSFFLSYFVPSFVLAVLLAFALPSSPRACDDNHDEEEKDANADVLLRDCFSLF